MLNVVDFATQNYFADPRKGKKPISTEYDECMALTMLFTIKLSPRKKKVVFWFHKTWSINIFNCFHNI